MKDHGEYRESYERVQSRREEIRQIKKHEEILRSVEEPYDAAMSSRSVHSRTMHGDMMETNDEYRVISVPLPYYAPGVRPKKGFNKDPVRNRMQTLAKFSALAAASSASSVCASIRWKEAKGEVPTVEAAFLSGKCSYYKTKEKIFTAVDKATPFSPIHHYEKPKPVGDSVVQDRDLFRLVEESSSNSETVDEGSVDEPDCEKENFVGAREPIDEKLDTRQASICTTTSLVEHLLSLFSEGMKLCSEPCEKIRENEFTSLSLEFARQLEKLASICCRGCMQRLDKLRGVRDGKLSGDRSSNNVIANFGVLLTKLKRDLKLEAPNAVRLLQESSLFAFSIAKLHALLATVLRYRADAERLAGRERSDDFHLSKLLYARGLVYHPMSEECYLGLSALNGGQQPMRIIYYSYRALLTQDGVRNDERLLYLLQLYLNRTEDQKRERRSEEDQSSMILCLFNDLICRAALIISGQVSQDRLTDVSRELWHVAQRVVSIKQNNSDWFWYAISCVVTTLVDAASEWVEDGVQGGLSLSVLGAALLESDTLRNNTGSEISEDYIPSCHHIKYHVKSFSQDHYEPDSSFGRAIELTAGLTSSLLDCFKKDPYSRHSENYALAGAVHLLIVLHYWVDVSSCSLPAVVALKCNLQCLKSWVPKVVRTYENAANRLFTNTEIDTKSSSQNMSPFLCGIGPLIPVSQATKGEREEWTTAWVGSLFDSAENQQINMSGMQDDTIDTFSLIRKSTGFNDNNNSSCDRSSWSLILSLPEDTTLMGLIPFPLRFPMNMNGSDVEIPPLFRFRSLKDLYDGLSSTITKDFDFVTELRRFVRKEKVDSCVPLNAFVKTLMLGPMLGFEVLPALVRLNRLNTFARDLDESCYDQDTTMDIPRVSSNPAFHKTALSAAKKKFIQKPISVVPHGLLKVQKVKQKDDNRSPTIHSRLQKNSRGHFEKGAFLPIRNSKDERPILSRRLKHVSVTSSVARTPHLVVIDGSNVAVNHGSSLPQKKTFSSEGLRLAIQHFQSRNCKVVAFVPENATSYEKVGAAKRALEAQVSTKIASAPDNVAMLLDLKNQGVLFVTPAQDYDDSYCIKYAFDRGGCVVTNDRYRDFLPKAGDPKLARLWLKQHLISFAFVGDEFVPNPDFRWPKKWPYKDIFENPEDEWEV